MNRAFLLIGGNMGDREYYLAEAREGIKKSCGVIARQSSLYQTAAWGLEDQAPFLNQVLEVTTSLTADELLQEVLHIEEALGRRREARYGPRIIDIDILFFNREVMRREHLTVPHPQLPNRRFALVPLNEIAANFVHPALHKSIAQLLQECPDPLDVHKI